MGDEVTRHSRILEATKVLFVPCTGGTASSAIGGFTGYLINADAQYAYTNLNIPWNFVGGRLTEAKVVFIAYATLNPMNFRVVTDYCQAEHGYFDHNQLLNYNVNTVLNRLQESDISQALVDITSGAPLEAKDYLGVQIGRVSGQNTNALFVGVKIGYNTPIYATAP
jgi:hypothetical protein